MALKLLQPGIQPLGQFDIKDGDAANIKGGEVVTLVSLALPSSDLAASDVYDGYVNADTVKKRVYATNTIASDSRPLFLADDGIAGYGTLLGSVVGGTVGQQVGTGGTGVRGGAVLGPHTTTGSGKLTLWDKAGLYAVSLDGAADSTAGTGLVPSNTTLDTGDELYTTAAGRLTPGAHVGSTVVGRFVDFTTNGSLVTTPNYLVAAFNLPISATNLYSFATFYFTPPA
jgi:hypothetical protein